MNEKNKVRCCGARVPDRLRLLFISAGSAGFERNMVQGNVSAAVFDGAMSIVGVLIMARGLGRPA